MESQFMKINIVESKIGHRESYGANSYSYPNTILKNKLND